MNSGKMKAILVDDEEKARRGLKNLLQHFCPEVDVIDEASDIVQAYEAIQHHQPDVVFLDIQMPNGSGFELLRQFKELSFDVIFVTGYDRYAINAIKFSALDYLLKPVEVPDLLIAVKKALLNKTTKHSTHQQIINLLNIADSQSIDKRIAVHKNEKVLLIKLDEIAYIEADNRYCNLFTKANVKYTVTKTLKEFEEFLLIHPLFIRIGKNCILNINCIKHYSKGEPCFVALINGREFEVSRRKKQEFLERLKR